MEELVGRVSQAASIPPAQAQRAIGLIFAFLRKEGPAADVEALLQMLPGAMEATAAAEADQPKPNGLFGGLMSMVSGGSGLMGLATQLTSIGLGTGEMAAVGKSLFAYAKEKAGDERIDHIAASVPGLSQLV